MLVWHAQEHPTSCVAACVRIVLSGLEKKLTEAQVRRLLGCPRLGITLGAARDRLAQAGAKALLETNWSFDDIRDSLTQGRYPIVGVERHLLGYEPASHAVVIVSMTSKRITVLDPLDGPNPKQYGLRSFELAWRLSGKEALVIESPPRASGLQR